MLTKALVTGAGGMLGSTLCPLLVQDGYKVYATDIVDGVPQTEFLDIRDLESVKRIFHKIKPDIVFHLAAETDVDKSEKEPEAAYLTNLIGTENIALACQENETIMVYISTAGVFGGEKPEPYTEFDLPNPVNIYGKTKWEGEKIVANLLSKYFIIRAGWMVGGGKLDKKFVGKIVHLLREKKELTVVNDKIGTPTFTGDFSRCMIALVKTGRFGLYHMTNHGVCSRYDVACKIVKILKKEDKVTIIPINSASFPLPAARSRSEALVNFKLKLIGMDTMRPWEEALTEYVEKIISEES